MSVDLAKTLGGKIGGVPVAGVAAVGAAGVGWILFRKRGPQAAKAPADPSSASSLSAGTGTATIGGFGAAGGAVPLVIPSNTAYNTGLPDLGSQGNPLFISTAGDGTAGAISAAPTPVSAPAATPTPAPAPLHPPGSIFFDDGRQGWYASCPDLYALAQPGQPGYGTHGAGANEVNAWIHGMYANATITPQWLTVVNGTAWYGVGQIIKVGNPPYGGTSQFHGGGPGMQ